ncbi:protein rep [Caenibacillus caldisaponilyticus]|uniref:protein rep n=1 Tax=Caenibacillus caldisaponilyticus TaxID=1674942 RepID=UPI00350E4E42
MAREKSWSQLTAEHFDKAGLERKAERMDDCADTLVFKSTPEGLKLYQAWFCKVRLCPMCNWRRSLKIAHHNKRIVEAINERFNVRWLFLTLTVKNTDGEGLPEALKAMFKGFNRLTKYKAFKTSVKGYFRALEVTRNRDLESESFGTYHPHFHVLLCVSPSYFTRNYIKQSEWTSLWKKAMKLDYTPIVHVEKVKPKEQLDDLKTDENEFKKAIKEQKAILEVSKYPVKDTDVIKGNKVTDENVETVLALDNALAYKRLFPRRTGCLKRKAHNGRNAVVNRKEKQSARPNPWLGWPGACILF